MPSYVRTIFPSCYGWLFFMSLALIMCLFMPQGTFSPLWNFPGETLVRWRNALRSSAVQDGAAAVNQPAGFPDWLRLETCSISWKVADLGQQTWQDTGLEMYHCCLWVAQEWPFFSVVWIDSCAFFLLYINHSAYLCFLGTLTRTMFTASV